MVIRALLVIGPGAEPLAAQVQARVEAVAAGAPMRWRRIGPEVTEEEIAEIASLDLELMLQVEVDQGGAANDIPNTLHSTLHTKAAHGTTLLSVLAQPQVTHLTRLAPPRDLDLNADPLTPDGQLTPSALRRLDNVVRDTLAPLCCSPLTQLTVSNLGPIHAAELSFSPTLNVIIGENSTGKSWLMKLLYGVGRARARNSGDKPEELRASLIERLQRLFLPDDGALGRLVRRGAERCEVSVTFSTPAQTMAFGLSDKGALTLTTPPSEAPPPTLFIPSRETLAMYEGFVSLYSQRALSIEETYYDLCLALATPLLRELTPGDARLLGSVEALLGGRLRSSGGRFYRESDGDRVEAHLLSEGLRKIGTLARLIQNGSLRRGSVLFWDEPEANMNPRLLKRLAAALVELAAGGVQVFLATHSLFLLRELHIQRLLHPDGPDARYIGLSLRGAEVVVAQGAELTDLPDIAALDEELDQSDRLMELHNHALSGAIVGESKP